jgi:hypothetical protein
LELQQMVFERIWHDRKCCGKFDEGVQIVWNGEEMHSISTIFSPRVLVNFFQQRHWDFIQFGSPTNRHMQQLMEKAEVEEAEAEESNNCSKFLANESHFRSIQFLGFHFEFPHFDNLVML